MAGASDISGVSTVASLQDILSAQQAAQKVFVDDRIRGYTVDVVNATRHPNDHRCGDIANFLDAGASVRASINLIKLAKAQALLDGRDYVSPHDVKVLAKEVLRHRIALSYEAEAQGKSADDIVSFVLDRIEVP
jgi:MoxR-like ATPase